MTKIKLIFYVLTCVLTVETNAFAGSKDMLIGSESNSAKKVRELMYAVTYRHKDMAELLISNGAEVNIENEDGYTPLMLSAQYREIVEFLISKGADVSAKDKDGHTFEYYEYSANHSSGDVDGWPSGITAIIVAPIFLAMEAYDTVTGWFKK